MKRLIAIVAALGLIGSLIPTAVLASESTERSYLVLSKGNAVPRGLVGRLEAAGGTVTHVVSGIGLVTVTSSDPGFAATASRINGVRSVSVSPRLQWIKPVQQVAVTDDFGNPPTSGDDDFFFDLQWGHDAVDAPEAWETGQFGDGARVAVLDTGFDLDHPDLAPNIDFAASVDFTGEGLQYTIDDVFSHGTHVAGTIAAADNAIGTIGVAPQAELILVKVLGDEGSGTFEDVISGIVHAADQGAHVINMSLGAQLQRRGFLDDMGTDDPEDDVFVTAPEVAELATALNRATSYAASKGTLVIASAGNDANNGDHDQDVIHLPSDSPHVVSISATGPMGWGQDPTTSLDEPAFYTNFGRSVIDFAAPGGNVDFDLFADESILCTVGPIGGVPCWAFDLVFSTGNHIPGETSGYFWSAGTSMAAPHASGVAALIVGANGGSISPAQIEAAMQQGADDLGSPGKDPIYGLGRVNALGSVD